MKNLTFTQWVAEAGLEPIWDIESPEAVEKTEEPTTKENRIRTGMTANYPDAYSRAQYPDGYNPPVKATAFLDLKQKANTGNKANYKLPPA